MAHGAVPLDSSHHEVLHVDHAGAARLQLHHVETLPSEVVTRDEWNPLALGEGAGVTGRGAREEKEEEEGSAGGEHRGTERREVKTKFLSFIFYSNLNSNLTLN